MPKSTDVLLELLKRGNNKDLAIDMVADNLEYIQKNPDITVNRHATIIEMQHAMLTDKEWKKQEFNFGVNLPENVPHHRFKSIFGE